MPIQPVYVPFGLFTFRAAIVLDGVFYSNMYFLRHGYCIASGGPQLEKNLIFTKNMEMAKNGIPDYYNDGKTNTHRVTYMPGLRIAPNGEIQLRMSYSTNRTTDEFITKFTARKRANIFKYVLDNHRELKYTLESANMVACQWNIRPITKEDIELVKDIILSEEKAVKIHGLEKVNAIKGQPLDPFMSNLIEMKHAEIDDKIKECWAIRNDWTLHDTDYETWNKKCKDKMSEKIAIQHEIIQTLIDINDQKNIEKITQPA